MTRVRLGRTAAARALLAAAAGAALLTAALGEAAPPGAGDLPPEAAREAQGVDAATMAARRHFKNGINLYRDTNYKGALAEFEAAYAQKPGPGSLQNTALCLKALFRYAEAAEALKKLLAAHGAELSEPEREAVRDAIQELDGLVGTLRVQLAPTHATLTVNGRPVSAEQRADGVRLNVGEHTLVAEAPGYQRHTTLVRIASQQRIVESITLRATAGFLEVVTDDPKAAIALDGEPLGYHRWSGPITPAVDHVVQVYRPGFEAFERSVRVDRGESVRVDGRVGARTGEAIDDKAPALGKPSAPPPPREPTGPYALFSVSVVGLNDAPLELQVVGTDADMSLPSFGLRGGYRISEPIAVEAAFDVGRLNAKGACQRDPASNDSAECLAERDFSLLSLRLGPALRLLTRGETFRFTSAIGVGFVGHRLALEPAVDTRGVPQQGGTATGIDPYFSLELGVAYNYRHFLTEFGLIAYIEGATQLRGSFDDIEEATVFENGALPMLGVALKLGYSGWSPRR
ncbi:MAG TPA: PEGA domain-containing protein [Polyangiaceae bacterium]|nr:PEGA domain-containing protein [Polyangiaceae bacterium]